MNNSEMPKYPKGTPNVYMSYEVNNEGELTPVLPKGTQVISIKEAIEQIEKHLKKE